MKHRLTSPNQFGSMLGKSNTDAALCLAHDIHAADKPQHLHQLIHITGYFYIIKHNRILAVLQNKGYRY